MPLTPRQQRFVEEYLLDLNGTQAARRAGYSERTANEQAARLLAKASIQEAVACARTRQQERVEITADDIRRGLKKEAQWYGDDGSASARVSAWRELGKLMGFYPAEGLDVNMAGRLELIEEVVASADDHHDHQANGKAPQGATRLPPQ